MTPNMLRQFWSLVETMQSNLILTLDDTSLVNCILEKIKEKEPLNPNQTDIVMDYIRNKLTLIRELAQQR
ncbi:MAG: hypothetical protein HC796_04065 [Synechococcaceae cyanobacterium RL_1_2]|nr:hypothetical protein [Synechococcaceae cyanobacterium RL_1_2]